MDLAADPQARAIGPDQRNPAGKGGALQAAELKGASNLLHGKAVNHSSILPFHAGLRGGHLTIACDLGIPLLFLVIGTLDSTGKMYEDIDTAPETLPELISVSSQS